jgi:hypothetical protein
VRRSDLDEGDRAAGLALTIQIVAMHSSKIPGAHDRLVAKDGMSSTAWRPGERWPARRVERHALKARAGTSRAAGHSKL